MKICVLQPDYSRSDIDYGNYDPSRNLTAILAPHEVHHVAINKLTTFRQLRDLSKQGFDLYVNLIEGRYNATRYTHRSKTKTKLKVSQMQNAI